MAFQKFYMLILQQERNNGSAFAGLGANTVFINVSIGLIMLFVRFVPMIATLAIAGSLVKKKKSCN